VGQHDVCRETQLIGDVVIKQRPSLGPSAAGRPSRRVSKARLAK